MLVFVFLVTILNARSVADPVRSVRDALRAVERGNLDADVDVYDGTELGQLQSGFNAMVSGLRERETIRDSSVATSGRRSPPQPPAHGAGEIELGGETRICSVLFVDLVGSTTYATQHSPAEVVAVLNRFFAVVVDEVDRHRGLVNKFIGDAVLAVFGAPWSTPTTPPQRWRRRARWPHGWPPRCPEVGAGIGVATGQVVAGNVGHQQRFEYTVIGERGELRRPAHRPRQGGTGCVLASWECLTAAEDSGSGEAAHWKAHGEVVAPRAVRAHPHRRPRLSAPISRARSAAATQPSRASDTCSSTLAGSTSGWTSVSWPSRCSTREPVHRGPSQGVQLLDGQVGPPPVPRAAPHRGEQELGCSVRDGRPARRRPRGGAPGGT